MGKAFAVGGKFPNPDKPEYKTHVKSRRFLFLFLFATSRELFSLQILSHWAESSLASA